MALDTGRTSPRAHRYLVALVSAAVSLVAVALLREYGDTSTLSPVVGAVAFSCWYGGVGPGLFTAAVGWLSSWFAYADGEAGIPPREDLVRFFAALVVSLVVIGLAWALQRVGSQATVRADLAEHELRRTASIQLLTRELSTAVSSSDVAHTLVAHVPAMIGASGAALGLIDGDELRIVDPVNAPRQTLSPGMRLALTTRAPITTAARTGQIAMAARRSTFERDYPDGAALASYAAGAVAAPLRVAGVVVGSMGFPFTQPDAIDADTVAVIELAIELGGQALERARLYEREQGSRQMLTRRAQETRRLLDVTAALAAALDPEAVVEAAVQEAMEALGASAGALVRLQGRSIEFVGMHGYPDAVIASWGRLRFENARPLVDAIRRNEVVAIESREQLQRRFPHFAAIAGDYGAWLALPLTSGARVVGGLALSFESGRDFDDGDRAFALALSRQAGQALEHALLLEGEHDARVRAERMAGELARLHALSTSLGKAPSAVEVASMIVELLVSASRTHTAGLYALDSMQGRLVLLHLGGRDEGEQLDVPRTLAPGESSPITEVVRTGTALWLEGGDHAASTLAGGSAMASGAIGVVPLVVDERTIGAVFAVFDDPHLPNAEEQRFVETVARQGTLPLERVSLLENERRARRRSERLQGLTGALSGALTPAEVIEIALDEGASVVGASGAAIVRLNPSTGSYDDDGWLARDLTVPDAWASLDSVPMSSPLRQPTTTLAPTYLDDVELASLAPEAAGMLGDGEHATFALVPLLADRIPFAIAILVWRSTEAPADVDRSLVETVASQLGQALDRAERYDTERTIAETLQLSILPETLSSMEGATVAARYLPGSAAVDVGGDWFDTIPLPDGRLGFVVGDVVGKGVRAASTMARLRNGMRALTLDSADPSIVMTKLNRMLDGTEANAFATVAFVVIDPETLEATLASAGHLPPLVIPSEGELTVIDGSRGVPLGVDDDTSYETVSFQLDPGSYLVLYTDGLVERRDRPLDEGLALLREAAQHERHTDPDAFIDRLVERLVGSSALGDDVAVLVVALDRAALADYSVRLPSEQDSLIELRTSFGQWLERGAIPMTDRRDLMLATWEASANAIEHARDPAESSITVDAHLIGDRIRVEVADTGTWREARNEVDRGFGLGMIRELVTSVDVERSATGTTIVMERVLTRERAGRNGDHGSDGL